MGYSYRNNGNIKDFWPDDDDNTMYISSGCDSLQDLINLAQDKWPGTLMEDIEITSEKIHTSCLTYDLYNSSDYTDFIILTRRVNLSK